MQVKLSGLEKVLKGFKDFPEKIQREIGYEFKAASEEIERIAKRNAPKDQGQLIRAITTKELDLAKYEVVAQNQIAPIMEFGTKSNARVDSEFATYAASFKGMTVNGTGTLKENILAWVKRKKIGQGRGGPAVRRRRKGGEQEKEFKSIAFLIARKIAREGVKAHPFLMPAFKEVKRGLIKNIINVLRK